MHAFTGAPLVSGVGCWLAMSLLSLSTDVADLEPGVGNALNVVLTGTAFLAPLAAGAAVVVAARIGRSGVVEIAVSTPKGRHAPWRVGLASVALWQAMVVVSTLLILRARLGSAGVWTGRGWVLFLLVASVLSFACVVGTVVGRYGSAAISAPAVAVAGFLWIYGWSFADGRAQRLSPIFTDVFYRTWLVPHVSLVLAQAGALLATAVALLVSVVGSLVVRAGLAALAVVIGVVSGVTLATVSTSPVSVRPTPPDVPCQQRHDVELCHWPQSQRSQVSTALQAIEEVRTDLAPWVVLPTRYREVGLRIPGRQYQMPAPAEKDFLPRAVQAAVPTTTCRDRRAVSAEYDLASLYSSIISGRPAGDPRLRRLMRGPADQVKDWIADRQADLTRCHAR